MIDLDPYIYLLRNFSKHKFKLFIEESILNPSSYEDHELAEHIIVSKDRWEDSDLAHVDMPGGRNLLLDIIFYNRWIFHLQHLDDGFIRPDMIWEEIRKDCLDIATRLSTDSAYLAELKDTFNAHIIVPSNKPVPQYDHLYIYYLTNFEIDPHAPEWSNELGTIDSELKKIFVEQAKQNGLELRPASFQLGFGSPSTFVNNRNPELAIDIIKRIESRPDSLDLQFDYGRIKVLCSNKRLINVYDKTDPKLILVDQIIESNKYFLESEIQEFEELLNRPNLQERQLQLFFEAYPKFLLGIDYDELRPQVSLVDELGEELVPDFLLRPMGKMLWDIMDLKLPNVPLIVGTKNREDLSYQVHRGISQLMNYARYFDNPRNRDRINRIIGINCFKPKLTLVIGNKQNVDEALWNKIMEQQRPFVNIVGFDEILERARRWMVSLPTA